MLVGADEAGEALDALLDCCLSLDVEDRSGDTAVLDTGLTDEFDAREFAEGHAL